MAELEALMGLSSKDMELAFLVGFARCSTLELGAREELKVIRKTFKIRFFPVESCNSNWSLLIALYQENHWLLGILIILI